MKRVLVTSYLLLSAAICLAQWNTDRIMTIGRNALYFEDYVLSIQYFNRVISVKPYLAEPYMYRGMAKAQLGDYRGGGQRLHGGHHAQPLHPAGLLHAWLCPPQAGLLPGSRGRFHQSLGV